MQPNSGSRRSLLVLALATALLLGASLLIYLQGPSLGFRNEGPEVVFRAQPQGDQSVSDEAMQRVVDIVERRAAGLGVPEPHARRLGEDQVVVSLADVEDPHVTADVLRSSAQLKLYDIHEVLEGKPNVSAYRALEPHQADLEKQEADALYLFGDGRELIAGPQSSREALLEDAEKELGEELDGKLPPDGEILGAPPGKVLVSAMQSELPWGEEFVADQARATDRVYMLLDDSPAVTGDDIGNADADIQNGGWVTNLEFTKEGSAKFGDLTEQLFRRGELRQQNQHFAIVLDNEIRSVPFIDYTDPGLRGGIRGGGGVIQGLTDGREARDLAAMLDSGSLPLQLQTVSTRQVLPGTPSKESVSLGLLAAAATLVAAMVWILLRGRRKNP